jgi:FtsP/CotA-like multicopper oxidase with cupredoxin domain
VLRNNLPADTSIVFPGQEGVTANGVPSNPEVDGSGAVTSLAPTAAQNGGSVSYRFVASQPGTYYYESGTDQGAQVDMGLYGALVVRPTGHPDWAYSNVATRFNASTEYVMLLSQIDPALHAAIENGNPFDLQTYRPRYYLINGRSFPDTIAPNYAAWLPNQPYGAFAHIQPHDATTNPWPALVRYVNVGDHTFPFHPHGNHGTVVARDGRLLRDLQNTNQSLAYQKFTVAVGAGQTADGLYDWADVEHWKPTTNPIPVTLPVLQDLTFKGAATYYSGSPYLGFKDELPTGTTSFNQCGEYYHVLHSHALFEVTNYGAAMGGMLTLERVDPPGGCP